MKKEVKSEVGLKFDNSFGVASVILGILSIVFMSFNGVVLAIIGLIFSNKQKVAHPNNWSKSGMVVSIIGLILSIVASAFEIYYYLNKVSVL